MPAEPPPSPPATICSPSPECRRPTLQSAAAFRLAIALRHAGPRWPPEPSTSTTTSAVKRKRAESSSTSTARTRPTQSPASSPPSPPEAPKRRRTRAAANASASAGSPRTALAQLMAAEIDSYRNASTATTAVDDANVVHILLTMAQTCGASMDDVRALLAEEHLHVSPSMVQFVDIAPFMHLDPVRPLNKQLDTFPLRRAHFPDQLHNVILADLKVSSGEYGTFDEHENEATRNVWMQPLWRHTVNLFHNQIRAVVESTVAGSITTEGRIDRVVFALDTAIMKFVEIKLNFPTSKNRYEKIFAQVLAECDACAAANCGMSFPSETPVFGMLTDGRTFEFYQFTRAKLAQKECPLLIGAIPSPSETHPATRISVRPDVKQGTPEFSAAYRDVESSILYVMLSAFRHAMLGYAARESNTVEETAGFKNTAAAIDRAIEAFSEADELFHTTGKARSRAKYRKEADNMAKKAIELLDQALREIPVTFRKENDEFFAEQS